MTTRGFWFSILQGTILVFLPDVPLHARIGLVDVFGDRRFDVLGIEDLVHEGISV
jgi:hypothetical protein